MEIPSLTDMCQHEIKLKVPEIRVWCHPRPNGDDYYQVFETFKEALKFITDNKKNDKFMVEDEPLIAFRGYELNIFAIKEGKNGN